MITVSGALAEEVKWQYQVPDWKLRTVQNGINCSRFDGFIDPAVCRATYGIGPLDPMALYVGRMSTQKGPDLLLEAVPGILGHRSDAKIVFVGDGDMRSYLERRAWELGVHHAVRFLGAMGAWSDLVNLYKSADVVCVPAETNPSAWSSWRPGRRASR